MRIRKTRQVYIMKLHRISIIVSAIFFILVLVPGVLAATPISFGETVSGTISTLGQTDNYTFSATAGDTLVARIRSSWEYYTVLLLYSPTGTLVSSCFNNGQCEITATAPDTGTYLITAYDYDSDNTGDYTLLVQRPNNPTNTTALTYGEQVRGNITNGAMLDTYTFSGTSGDQILIQMNNAAFNAQLRLYAPNGTLLQQAADGLFSDIGLTLPATGTYVLVASTYDGINTGPYALIINSESTGTPLTLGTPVTSAISTTGELDQYTFSATAGDTLIARIRSSWEYYTVLLLYSPTGTLVSSCFNNGQCEITATAPDTGTYLITAYDYDSDNTGDYTLLVQRPNNPTNTTALTYGEQVRGNITNGAMLDTYTFSGTSGDQILIQMNNAAFNAQLRLYAPNGTLLQQAADGLFSDIGLTLPATGTYVLVASTYDGINTGPYALIINSESTGTPLTLGTPVTSAISTTGELDQSTFSATAGDTLIARIRSSWEYYTVLLLYSPTGTLVSSCFNNGQCEITATAPDTGTYLITAYDYDSDNTGDYTLLVQRPNNPTNTTALTYGEQVLGNITNGAMLDTYTFSGTSGDQILIQMNNAAFVSQLRLYAPNGTLLQQAAEGLFSDINVTLPASGTYVLIASDVNGWSTGAYTLIVNSESTGTPLAIGTPVIATIETPGELDQYHILRYCPVILLSPASGQAGNTTRFSGFILPTARSSHPVQITFSANSMLLLR